jgi:GDP-4-dehydro-6-deoxy-D-mannose reductase
MTEVIVTGADGFIGRAVVSRLRGSGYDVLERTSKDGDVADPATWADLPAVDAVIHLAGRSYVPASWSAPSDFLKTNVLGTARALDYCRRYAARLILASAYVYGVPDVLPINERHPIRPNNPYALSKRIAEELCEFAFAYQGVSTTVLRIFNVFGSGQRPEFLIPTIIAQIRRGIEVRVQDLSPRRDYVHLDDLADLFVCALKFGTDYQVFNVGSGISHSVGDLIDHVQQVMRTDLPVSSEAIERRSEIADVVADISCARTVLGWAPRVTLAEGLRRCLHPETQHGSTLRTN